MNQQDAEYFRGRSGQEAAAAIGAINPAVAHIHLEMAARYAVKAQTCEFFANCTTQPYGSDGSRVEDSFHQIPQFS